jgi:hypothetical protein
MPFDHTSILPVTDYAFYIGRLSNQRSTLCSLFMRSKRASVIFMQSIFKNKLQKIVWQLIEGWVFYHKN